MTIWDRKKPSFGFISTRFAGLDGVSLETHKWADMLRSKGCSVYFMAGELDTDPEVSHLVPKAHFKHEEILKLQQAIFIEKKRTPEISRKIQQIKEELKEEIKNYHSKFGFEILIVQNALAIPLNIPLGLAITEFIIETEMPTIAHHHDFFWERDRFSSPVASDYLRSAFPPVHPKIQHVVINSIAGHKLGGFTGASWTLIPNIVDFKTLPPGIDDFNKDLKKEIGLDKDTILILQPTRVVSRKGIEISLELVKRLAYPKASLVITHKAEDEGQDYLMRIEEFVKLINVDLKIISDRIGFKRGFDEKGRKIFKLWDVYQHADLITYPSLYEGYGNAFVESIYFRKPIAINRYPIFIADIEPKGFEVISFDNYITNNTITKIKELLNDPERLSQMAEKNYMLGWRYLSFEMLEEKIEQLLINHYGS
ncbi:MAG: glycosyltransferase family 4 protein [Proteobacteria bacterium]|nr:glycosyltransferase family 4 protein [Pseudomonadota bacterium]MBU4100228.1 glycosyltransferase family 4 protein [Pseudomonadota bacterium]MBU4126566.1 glycosyltransferase family 4 protein [Pseudomonadota bacterium]